MTTDLPVSTGTTIMAIKFDGGVVLGADTRTSSGAFIVNRVADKIVPLRPTIWSCRSGSAADTQALVDIVNYYLEGLSMELGREPDVHTAAHIMHRVSYSNKDNMLAGMIVAGYDAHRGSQIYSITLGGSLISENWSIGGSGSTYLYGLVDAEYKDGMTKEECVEFVKKNVSHAIARDGSSGGMIRLVIIDKDGYERRVVKGNELPYGP